MGSKAPETDLIVLAGPTASGKTALALRLAQKLDAEIVNADSQQVYRYFDIGTAKPTAVELAQVRHHLISIVDPGEAFSAAHFQTLAGPAIQEIRLRSRPRLVLRGPRPFPRVLPAAGDPAPARPPTGG